METTDIQGRDRKWAARVAAELSLPEPGVAAVERLLDEGATIPFIARYRKEATGSLDEVAITDIRDRLAKLAELDGRKQAILKSLEERSLLTPELKAKVTGAETLTKLEDIYLPFRPKRKTKASMARERGLEPLAELVLAQGEADPLAEAARFIDPEKEVPDAEAALAGARDIIAERINEDQTARERLRRLFAQKAVLVSKVIPGKEDEGANFRDYFDWSEELAKAPSHRVLAIRRGAGEGFLSMRIRVDREAAVRILQALFVKAANPCGEQVALAATDCFKRLLGSSLEVEFRLASKKEAEAEAIKVFAENLRELLLASPLGQKPILAIDPGLRTGCKVAALDGQGNLLATETVYLSGSPQAREAGGRTIRELLKKHGSEVIAVGNGTGGRETEAFLRTLDLDKKLMIVMVSESGASVYSASPVAREEFPDLDVSLRGAVSIGRRLADPLAELVKIEPKSIGVGQYQHDVDQKQLKSSLDDVVISCVNAVGVEVNSASPQLLTYVSGLNPTLARNIVNFRAENGPFASRKQLLKVPRLGPKSFEQAAGFLRLAEARNPLDRSAVHPESYHVVEAMAVDLGCSVEELISSAELRARIDLNRYVDDSVGLPTLTDILAELDKPGRDPRAEFEIVTFAEGVNEISDLVPGMQLTGIVTNVTNFGAFVDVGVHQDGLVHISQLADRFVRHPSEEVKVAQKVKVRVLEVDLARRRISLTMRSKPEKRSPGSQPAGQQTRKQARPQPRPRAKPQKKAFNNAFAAAFDKVGKKG